MGLMSRPLLNRRLEGLGTTIFAEMSARALVTGAVNLGQGFPDRDGPAKIAQVAADAILAGRGNQYLPDRAGVVAIPTANAAKHAHARSVRIGLSHASGMLRAEVTDDGLRTALRARGQVPGLPVLVLSQYVEQL